MLRRFKKIQNLPLYATIVALDLCVAVAFGAILLPTPAAEKIEPLIVQRPIKHRITLQGIPVRVTVPSVAIDVRVKTGHYIASDTSWSIDGQTAFYADQTVPVNNSNGTTLIYGHDTWNIFGHLLTVARGAEANVYTSSGRIFHYKYQSSRQVSPSDVSVLDDSGPPTLVLQTCSGLYDMYRTLVAFNLARVSYDD